MWPAILQLPWQHVTRPGLQEPRGPSTYILDPTVYAALTCGICTSARNAANAAAKSRGKDVDGHFSSIAPGHTFD